MLYELQVVADQAFLEPQLRALTAEHEANRSLPWSADDAAADYLEATMKRVVPLEIRVSEISGSGSLIRTKRNGTGTV
jgi:transcriptional regulator